METGRPLQVPPTCPGVTFTPPDHRSLGSPGHSSCPHAVEIRRYVTCTVPSQGWHLWRTLLCAIPSVVVNLQSTWNTQHWTAVRCYPCPLPNRPMASSLRRLSLPIDSGGMPKTTITEWGSSFTKMWEWGLAAVCMDALGWYEWAVDRRLTLPLKCSAGSTAYGDSEQGAAQ